MFLALEEPTTVMCPQLFTRNLNQLLEYIWHTYFSDVPHANEVEIRYAYPWKRRLGLIRLALDDSHSFIGINSLLQHPDVPSSVLITTVAHELSHYAHGYGSPLPRLYPHPHANNVINNELEKRGLGEHGRFCDSWIDKAWFPFYDMHRSSGWIGIPGIQNQKTTRSHPTLAHRQVQQVQ